MDSDSYLTREDFVNVGIVAMEKQANRMDDVRAAFRYANRRLLRTGAIHKRKILLKIFLKINSLENFLEMSYTKWGKMSIVYTCHRIKIECEENPYP